MAPAAYALPTETSTIEEPAPVPAEPLTPVADQPPAADAPAVPVNVIPPVIDGDPVVGGTLTSTGGQWTGAGWLTYNWSIDGIALPTAGRVPGEQDALLLQPSMAGKSVRLTVEASVDAETPGNRVDAVSVAVRPAVFTGIAWNGAVAGKPAVGEILSLNAPVWNDAAGQSFRSDYQWYRGATGIVGATDQKYTVSAADVGQKLWAKATVSAEGFTSLALTSTQLLALKGSFLSSPAPVVSGTARVGQVQTVNPGTWAPTGASLSYQWFRGTVAIPGAIGRTYATTASDYLKPIKARVRATKSGFTTVDRFSAVRSIAAGNIVATKSLLVTGLHRYTQTLRISQAWTSGSTIRYQWYRNGSAVRGATGPSLYLSTGYIGARVNVKVTVSKPGYTTRSAVTKVVTVGKALIGMKSSPRVTGGGSLGSTLTANVGTYSVAPSAYSYQWYRNGAAISGARSRTYRVAAADNGKSVSVRVWASKAYYDTRSALTTPVKLPVWAVTVLRGDGTYRVGTGIKPGLYKSTGGGSSCYWERVSGFSGSLSQIKANYFGPAKTYVQILPGDVGFVTKRCGSWTTVPSTGARATRISANGTYRVGIDILPGTYYGSSAGESCYWATLRGFSGTFNEIIDNYIGSARVIVTVPAAAKGFEVHGCGTLTRR